jgi:hypothetical protein
MHQSPQGKSKKGSRGGSRDRDVSADDLGHNGTVVYSTEITPTTNATSAAGETFTFMSGANGTYVPAGQSELCGLT